MSGYWNEAQLVSTVATVTYMLAELWLVSGECVTCGHSVNVLISRSKEKGAELIGCSRLV